MDALYALAQAPRAARDRGRGARHGLALAGTRIGAFGDLVVVQLPSEQEHDDDRGRRARRATTRDEARRVERLRFHGIRALRRRHARRRVARRQVQPARRHRAHRPRAARSGCGVQRARGARCASAISSASRPSPPCVLPPRPARRRRPTGTCSRRCCRSTAWRSTRQAFRDALHAARHRHGVSTRRSICRTLVPRARLPATATSRTPSASPTRTVTLPLFTPA